MNTTVYQAIYVLIGVIIVRVLGHQGFLLSPTTPLWTREMYRHTRVENALQCARLCSDTWPCDTIQHCTEDAACVLYASCEDCEANSVNCSDAARMPLTAGPMGPKHLLPEPLTCASHKYLVTGPDGVPNNQLSASSFFCDDPSRPYCGANPQGLGPKYARLTSVHPWGSWSSAPNAINQHIQVDFQIYKLVTGIVLTGRAGVGGQYTKSFKVAHSGDCVNFTTITDGMGSDKVFAGCSYQAEFVTHCFPLPIPARCIRILPVTWNKWQSLRFDVLGF